MWSVADHVILDRADLKVERIVDILAFEVSKGEQEYARAILVVVIGRPSDAVYMEGKGRKESIDFARFRPVRSAMCGDSDRRTSR